MKLPSRLYRTLSATVATALVAALVGPVTPAIAASQTIGGVGSEGNLRILVEDSGQMGVERYASGSWVSQIYNASPGSKGSALHINGALFPLGYFMYDSEWNVIGTPGTPVSNATVGNTITTVWTAGSTTITQTTQYTNGNPFYRLQWQITNTSGASLSDLRFFHGEDTYLLGGDNGSGFWDGANNIIGVYKTDGGGVQQRMSLQGVTTPTYRQSENFGEVLIAGGAGRLTNVINEDVATDNGYALEWDNGSLAAGATWTITAYESFVSGAVGALNVSAPISTDCAPGATCDLVYTVSNPTGASVNAALSVAGDPAGWTPTIISPASPVDIAGGASQPVTVRLTIPGGVPNGTAGSFTLTANDGATDTSATAAVNIVAAASADADLTNLALSAGTLTPSFAAATTSYTATVANGVTSLTVTPTASDANATITVNGTTVASGAASGAIALSVGANTITTVVTAEDGTTTKTYTVTLTRAAQSTNADLTSLVLNTASLTPSFDPATTSYTATVPYATTSQTVTPTASDANATITVNGTTVASGATSGAIALSVGANTITTVVTAEDGTTTKTYTVTVTREAPSASSDADLTSLVLNTASLTPSFDPATLTYTATVPYATTSQTVTPTASDANATITVNGTTVASGATSGAIALSVGANVITTVVTAEDTVTTKTYTVTITREPSANADLTDLVLSAGTLTPAFDTGTISYTASVPHATTSLVITPTVSDTNATIEVNGAPVTSGTPSGAITLNVGANSITTVVTAQDGSTTKTYTVIVTRAGSSDADLGSLVTSEGTLSPAFDSGTTAYTMTVGWGVHNLTLTPTSSDANATITVNGVTVTSGNASSALTINQGETILTVEVTAEDGVTVKTYTITVTRPYVQILSFIARNGTLP
ncbi:MAG: cadherin-like beta sandwich domain-containing protein [Anaerolineales bacterium]|nr:cadherin-like beta sandwich domain-containing protein [Anaerolineales bacterium]